MVVRGSSSMIRFITRRSVMGMIPGMMGTVMPAARARSRKAK